MSGDRSEQLAPRPAAIRRPTGDQPAARAADTFQAPDPPVAEAAAVAAAGDAEPRRRGRPRRTGLPPQRTTVVYPADVLQALKIEGIRGRVSVGELARDAIAAGLRAPARLAEAADAYVGVAGTRTTLDLPAEQHRKLKVLAAEKGVTVQSLVLAAVVQAHPNIVSNSGNNE